MTYDPQNWYWLADDGRLFGSARQAMVPADDAAFGEWLALGLSPTPWPKDDAGQQTNAALQEVLAPYGLYVDLTAYAADKRWQIETGGIAIGGVPIATDDRSKIMIMGARVAAAVDPNWSTVWHGADGETYPLNAASMIAISDAVEAHVNATFARFAEVKVDIDAGTITTTAEIDAIFAG